MGDFIVDLESIALVVCGTDTEQGKALLDMAAKHPEDFFTPLDARTSFRADQSQVKARKLMHSRNGDCVQNQLAMLAFGETFVGCVRKLAKKIVAELPTRKIWVICCSTGEIRSDCLAKALVTRVFNGVKDDERIFNANIFSTSGVDRDGIEATVVQDARSWANGPWLTRRDDRKWGHDAEVASQLAFNTLRDLDLIGRYFHDVVAKERKLGRHRPSTLALLPTPPPAPPPPALLEAAKREAAAGSAPLDTKDEPEEDEAVVVRGDDEDEDMEDDAVVGESLKRAFHWGEASSSVAESKRPEPKRQRRQSVEQSVCPFCQGTGRDEGDTPKVDTAEAWAHILEKHAGLDDRALSEWKMLFCAPYGLGKEEALFLGHQLLKRDEHINNPSAFIMSGTKVAWQKIRPNPDRAREAASRQTPIGRGGTDEGRHGGPIGIRR